LRQGDEARPPSLNLSRLLYALQSRRDEKARIRMKAG
jgi:hypothetical protein